MRSQAALEQLRRWRQAAVWAPIFWFPLVIYAQIMGQSLASIGVGLAGLAFWGLARAVVWSARCPSCEAPFRQSPAGFERAWDESSCAACGLSLFELRRGRARD